jgi:hypothetical protein
MYVIYSAIPVCVFILFDFTAHQHNLGHISPKQER